MGCELKGCLRRREFVFEANTRAKFIFSYGPTEVGGETKEAGERRRPLQDEDLRKLRALGVG